MGLGVCWFHCNWSGFIVLVLKAYLLPAQFRQLRHMLKTIEVLTGFSLSAESIALFARVGGGIYTKLPDVGADPRW